MDRVSTGSIRFDARADESAETFTLAAGVAIPGFGGSGPPPCLTNPGFLSPVLLFQFNGTKPVAPLPSIPPCPLSFVNDAFGVAFNAQGELFVGNRHGNQESVFGSIARFVFDQDGNPHPNGVIIDPSLRTVHGLAFGRTGELFAANPMFSGASSGTIARFRFDRSGAAIPNGTIDAGPLHPTGLAFNRRNELFVATQYGGANDVLRFVFDRNGTAILSGAFDVPGASFGCCHELEFNHRGELFVADYENQLIFRFLFDSAGNAIFNSSFAPNIGQAIGLAFSPAGELFVSSHTGGIARFLFDSSGNPIPNGVIATAPLGAVAVFP